MNRAESLFSLDGLVAVVTGGSGLLGPNHCRVLARAGAIVAMADVAPVDQIERVRREHFSGTELTRIRPVSVDVTSADSLREFKDRLLSEFGRLDILVNNAAVDEKVSPSVHGETGPAPVPFEDYPLGLWERSVSVNLTGVFLACQVLGPLMREKGGSIINVASTYGMVAPDQSLYVGPDGKRFMYKSPAYPATKGGVLSLTKYLAAYWGGTGIRVNALTPGGVENGQDVIFKETYSAKTMLGRMARPDDYAGAVLFLASDASRYMTGANLVVDGGWTAW